MVDPEVFPSFSELERDAGAYRALPVWCELPIERDALSVFLALKRLSRQCFVLESAEASLHGRYTFLGYDPKLGISAQDGEILIKNGAEIRIKGDPAEYISQVLDEWRAPKRPELPPFSGGLVGYFSYDYIKYSEPELCLDALNDEDFQDVDLMLFDKVIAFDHELQKIQAIIHITTDHLAENFNKALQELETMSKMIQHGEEIQPEKLQILSDFEPLFDKKSYCQMVETAKQHIVEGDIFQIVLSNRLHARVSGSLFDTYRALRDGNPSPYMFYFSSEDLEIAGAAPETLVKCENGCVTTFPLAGTRPRGANAAEDATLRQELLDDPKECAEHNMLVDLGRNDIGKIAQFNSVKVENYMKIVQFSHVMHIGSTVSGCLLEGCTALQAIDALLPAGTLSGAPKFKACEIINRLEGCKRGIYGGAIGYLSFGGDMDTCIAIRIAFKKNGKIFLRSGAGIVADSVPEREFEECENKMRAVRLAIERSVK